MPPDPLEGFPFASVTTFCADVNGPPDPLEGFPFASDPLEGFPFASVFTGSTIRFLINGAWLKIEQE